MLFSPLVKTFPSGDFPVAALVIYEPESLLLPG